MLEDEDGSGQFAEDEVLDLTDEVEDDAPDPEDKDGSEDEPGAFVGFADDGAEEEDDTPLVKKLRDQIRTLSREKRRAPAAPAADDPEPVIPDVPDEDVWDIDVIRQAMRDREAAIVAHAEWKSRQADREAASKRAQEEQGRQLEQQRHALGVSEADYKARSAKVLEALSSDQVAILTQAADNPARLIFALGGSETRLDMLASSPNLAKFAAMIGTMEKEVKVSKRTAPPPETRVRGATAPIAPGTSDKKLAALEKQAERSGDRTALIAYKASLKQRAA